MKNYDVVINGMETTLQLSDADAKARGLKPADEPPQAEAKARSAPANKARTPASKRAPASGAKKADG